MPAADLPRRSSNKAAALIIVLAFVVLLTGLTLTFFSRTALDVVVSDLRQEITLGSASPAPTFGPTSSPGPYRLYVPSNTAYLLPQRSGNLAAVPNLIRRSIRSDPV